MEDVKIHYDQTVRNSSGHIMQFVYGGDNMDGCFIENTGKYKTPFNLSRMLLEFPKTTEALDEKIVKQGLDKLFKKIVKASCLMDCVRQETLRPLKELIYQTFEKTYISEKNFQKIVKMIYEKYERCMIQPSEMVGLISAQSIGKFFARGKYKIFIYTHSNCGKLLRALTTTFILKEIKGTRLIIEPNGKKVRDWTIRSQAPKFQSSWNNGEGSTTRRLWV